MTAIILDVETTGFSPHVNRIIELAIVTVDGALILHTKFNPECPIPEDITKLTGISDDDVKDSPKFRDIAGGLAEIITQSDAMIGYAIQFDRIMLSAEFHRAGVRVKFPTVVCAKRLWDKHIPKEQRTLQDAYRRFVDSNGYEGRHGALADTLACQEVFKSQFRMFNLENIPWNELDPEANRWWGPSNHIIFTDDILVVNFGKHKGTPCVYVERRYWRWLCEQDFPGHVKTLGDYLVYIAKPDITSEELVIWALGRDL